MDECAECGEEFPGDVTHNRCPRCGAKLHPDAKKPAIPEDDGPFLGNILGGY